MSVYLFRCDVIVTKIDLFRCNGIRGFGRNVFVLTSAAHFGEIRRFRDAQYIKDVSST